MTNAAVDQHSDMPLALGLIGILLACVTADINSQVMTLALADIRGHFGLGIDQGSWIETLFATGEAMGMLVAPWLAIAFSIRRFAAGATALLAVLGVVCALNSSPGFFLGLRFLQGLSTGFLIPLLMSSALRFLTPPIKLMGLAAYALTATFAPNMGAPIVAWAHQVVGYNGIYIATLPVAAIAFGLVVCGLPQDSLHLERFRQLDWRGALLGWGVCICVVVLFTQGERLAWMQSSLIVGLALALVVLLPAFVINEWFHPLPFIWPQILLRPNFGFGTAMLFGFIILSFSVNKLPSEFLGDLHGYRPLQTMPVALLIALPPLMLLPLVAFALNSKRMDARWFLIIGLCFIALTCWINSHVTPDWIRHNFYSGQLIAVIGQALVAVSLLMLATGVVAPTEGPYAASTINTVRALAAPVGTGLVDLYLRRRGDVHSVMLLDRVGANRYDLAQSTPLTGHSAASLVDPASAGDKLTQFTELIHVQSQVLAYADGWRAMLILAVVLILTCVIPQRVYPPYLRISPGT